MDDLHVKGFYKKLRDTIKGSDAVSYVYSGQKHTYAELYSQILKVNFALGGFTNEAIVTYTDKKFSTYGAIYGIFLSGNIWVPISLEMPESRVLEIFKQVNPKAVLHNLPLPPSLEDYLKGRGINILDLDEMLKTGKERELTYDGYRKDDIAYIMFTSGSTGVPKGVPMTHGNYINFVDNCMEILPFRKQDVFSDYHDFAFDISIFYIFCCPLAEGAFAPVMKEAEKIMPLSYIQENRITVWSSVPSVISRIQALKPNNTLETKIKIMFLCGEPFSLKVLDYCFNNIRTKDVYNFYGLTETGVENFHHKCSLADISKYEPYGFVPIGRPLKGNDTMITEEKELLLSGCQITPGYLGGINPEKFEAIDDIRWFHSGDIVEEHDGVYFCKGRMDSQVKLKGYRIELMDIEVHMKRFQGVDEAVCFVKEKNNKKSLAAVVRPKKGVDLNLDELTNFLSRHLPHYMVPNFIYVQEEIPVNRNGKINRRKIKEDYDYR